MARYFVEIPGNKEKFKRLVDFMEHKILTGSMSASLEEKQAFELDNVSTVLMAFERYSYTGGNRVSLTIHLSCDDKNIVVVGFATGGSQATFFKINTWGEEAFIDKLKEAMTEYLDKEEA